MMENTLVSVIIRSFNEEKHIGRLLDGLHHQTIGDKIEVILVDSGSTDGTVRIASGKGAKIVRINPDEFSFGRALNVGCEIANGEFLLFASAHVYPLYTDWVENMVAPFENPRIALVYGKQVGNTLTKYSEHQIFAKWFPRESNYNQKTPFCNNANAVIRKELWNLQQYDEQLTGLEDLDWASKIMGKGYQIAYESAAPIVHVHEETPKKVKNRYRREAIALKKIFPNEKFNSFDFVKLLISNIFSDSLHSIRDRVFVKTFREIVTFRFMQFSGTFVGFRQKSEITASLKNRLYYPNDFSKQPDPDTIFRKSISEKEKAISY